MVSPTIPLPGERDVSTRRYPSDKEDPDEVSPSRPASCGSGRMAIRLPPALTQSVSVATSLALKTMGARMATS